MKYDVKKIEPKWQKKWEDARIFEAKDFDKKPKFYGLIEFPYPSGAGMHVGHIKAYSSIEVVSRKRRMQGYNVLNPIGFDAFGLPTENYAIKTNTHPRVITDKNIHHFTQQLKSVGFSFDWSRVIDTTDEDYYKWTQWIFLKLFEHGLVFRDTTLVNYCPHCKVVLSNEDSQGGKCDICHNDVIQLPKKVWYLRITKYADKLLEGLKDVDYPENVKQQQIHWIGRSEGAFVNFSVKGTDDSLRVYTTRCDTLFGVTFMVVAPEHPLLDKHKDQIRNWDELEHYRKECAKKTEFERTQLVKDKTGVRLDGLTAIDPVNGREIPIFAADYVMMGYGTGAIMAVPAHDQRDWDFAHKFGCEIIPVIEGGDIEKEAYTGDGKMINSGFLNGYTNKKDSIKKMLEVLEEKGIGEKGVQYKMKDWAFNRQRYWGEPIPLIHCPNCGIVPVPYDQLPLKLPKLENFEPGQDGQSPLARVPEFVNCTCPKCGGKAQRETDTMPQWAGSSWYFLRYCDPHNKNAFADKDKLKYWMPVDWYNGGMEHVTRHMLYSRFWHRFLYDIGEVPCPEPYKKRTIQGLILGSDGDKMSKSKGNVIDPVDIVDQYGADTLRTYVLFMGDYSAAAPWNDSSVKGCRRFLDRVAGLTDLISDDRSKTDKLEAAVHRTIKKVSDDIEATKFNTAIAAMMTLINEVSSGGAISKEQFETFVKLLCPFAPHLCEELWEFTGHEGFCSLAPWPVFDESKTIEDEIEVAVQENGKLRTRITIKKDATKDEAIAAAKEALAGRLTGTIRKEIYVPGRIVNFVVSR
ncbi:leucine--tRNA ligase [Porcincola sp. LCP21S3_C12]|uniref:leucine--tRNA ligase n=1 Tax=Porcincola sp. LCP21S3_C12 TaxID=3438798 RepID=UPI003F96C357